MTLLIVESPTKARTIRKFLRNFYIIATYGHLFDLPAKEFGLYLENNRIKAKYLPLKGKAKIISKIKTLASKNREVLIASDPDREGEMIAFEVKMILNSADHEKIKRISVNEITLDAFKKALKEKDDINHNLVNAQKGRRFLDRIFGYKISPHLWSFEKGLSAGRVQSATLKIIVDREREIENFKNEEYYHLYLEIKDFPLKVALVNNKNQPMNIKNEHLQQVESDIRRIKEVFLKETITEDKKIYPPLPLDTENLQRFAFQYLKFSPKKTMFIAQKLFEFGLITYHRTQSHFINKNFSLQLKNLIAKKYGSEYAHQPRLKKEKYSFEAHEAIRPTKLSKPKIEGEMLKVWELILLFTIASHFKPAQYRETKFVFQNKNYKFLSINKELLFYGFGKVMPLGGKFSKTPIASVNGKYEVLKYEFKRIETKPPLRFTESSLIKKLKELGIGRPSTYVTTIETLKKRKYIVLEKNFIKPTELGKKINSYLEENFSDLVDTKFTAQMEDSLDKIAKNLLEYEKFVIDFWKRLDKKLMLLSQLSK
ncbi:MAG: type I DNA topoisomerase [Patescibacteria group bacterium]|nr:type I DNA topoisomerase [Patescibacteria group bacterium]